jgi:hypothetical protein
MPDLETRSLLSAKSLENSQKNKCKTSHNATPLSIRPFAFSLAPCALCPFLVSAFGIPNSSRPAPAITRFAGSVFGHMPFQLPAPQGLKCSAAAVQSVGFGKIRRFAAQVAEGDPARRDAGIFAIRFPAHVFCLKSKWISRPKARVKLVLFKDER